MALSKDTVSTAGWNGLSEEQMRMLKMAYLMGAKDAIKICESQLDGDLKGGLEEDLICSMDRRLGLVSTKM